MRSSQRVPVRATGRRLRRASASFSVLAILLTVLGWSGLIIVAGSFVVPPWVAGAASCCVAVILVVIGRRSRTVDREPSVAPVAERPGKRLRALPALGIVVAVLAALGDLTYSARYFQLDPTGPDGCRAVVREDSALLIGHGQVYSVQRWGVGWRSGSWTADDGARPVGDGTYRLSWGVGGGALVLEGRAGDPIYPALHGVSCS